VPRFCASIRRVIDAYAYYASPNGALGEIRTPDPRNRNPMLYPAELRARL
jgi:hypothetical protein